LFHGFDTLGSHLREEGSLDYDGGLVHLQVQMNFDTIINRQQWEPRKILLEGDGYSNKMNATIKHVSDSTTQVGPDHIATVVLLVLGTNTQPSKPKLNKTHSGNLQAWCLCYTGQTDGL
jgi:hypothetical protein